MRSVLVLWAARWRGLSQKQLRRLFLGSIAIHLGIATYVLVALPIVPIRPLCRDGNMDYDTPRRWIEGRLASDYFDAFERRFLPRMTTDVDGALLVHVTLAQALDWSDIEKQSDLALDDLIQTRLGSEAYADFRDGRTSIPGLNLGSSPSCVMMRGFADADGVWSKKGPVPFKLP